jgi:isoleucyl-tRNA synthetase
VELLTGEPDLPGADLAMASEEGVTVAVATHLTPELIQEGLAREAVRRVQELRKSAGLERDERIHLYYTATPELAAALEIHAGTLRDETLAVAITDGPAPPGAAAASDRFAGETLQIALTKAVVSGRTA